MTSTKKYILIIAILLVANLSLFFSEDFSPGADNRAFFPYSSNQLVGISIEHSEGTIELDLVDGVWTLNKELVADQGFVNTLLSVLERLERGRIAPVRESMPGGSLSLYLDDGSVEEIQYFVNANRTKTFFREQDKLVQVSVPGYRENVGGIFDLNVDQWRNRVIIYANWRTIQYLEVDQGNDRFEIAFDNKFFLLNGSAPQDTAAVVDYLNQYQMLQANEMISKGRFPVLDSISNLDPIAQITIDDLKLEAPKILHVFPRGAGQNFQLVIDSDNNWMVMDYRRIERLLLSP